MARAKTMKAIDVTFLAIERQLAKRRNATKSNDEKRKLLSQMADKAEDFGYRWGSDECNQIIQACNEATIQMTIVMLIKKGYEIDLDVEDPHFSIGCVNKRDVRHCGRCLHYWECRKKIEREVSEMLCPVQ